MSPEQLKIQELENKVAELESFTRSLHNPAQYNPDLTNALVIVISNNLALNDLKDVDTTGVSDEQVIKYNSSNQTWEPADDIDT